MRTKNLLKYGAAALAIAGLGSIAVNSAMAANPGDPATLGSTALVSIDSVLNISEVQQLNFGTLFRDPINNETWVLTTAGVLSGTASNVSSGTPNAGEYDITGNTALTFTLEIAATGVCTAGAGLVLSTMSMDVNGGGQQQASPAVSGLALNANVLVGARLTVNSSGIDGAATCNYTVTANY